MKILSAIAMFLSIVFGGYMISYAEHYWAEMPKTNKFLTTLIIVINIILAILSIYIYNL